MPKLKNLSIKQEAFCQQVVAGANLSDAYRASYSAENMKPNSIWNSACVLSQSPMVAQRIVELRAQAAERGAITVDKLMAELEEARQIAMSAETPQSGAAVAATMGKAKLAGLDKQLIEHTGKNGAAIEIATLDVSKLSVDVLAQIMAAKDAADNS